jgi:hypothetical protein
LSTAAERYGTLRLRAGRDKDALMRNLALDEAALALQ